MKLTQRPGYTLLELLIAIAIFSGVMILALGAFARSANSATKSNITRAKAEAARSVIDQISNDFRYISNDARPPGCTSVGFCVDPSGMTASPNKVSMLLKYPGQSSHVLKTYLVTNPPNLTMRTLENRTCTVTNGTLSCASSSQNSLLLDTKYWLDDATVFTGSSPTATDTGYLHIEMTLKPRSGGNCTVAGSCYKLETTLVPGGF